ncbi:hypothetical protein COX97_02780 [Candidatus Pacearchaeota archaeon CG_4_10_14_0_2_um_filter_05_32_18]|nr:MAG: hypothetical protein COX97_02780 [Candidatus Pacearchaeota archaeon CG_4_10_14_0_2_um_filter_05_32_18]
MLIEITLALALGIIFGTISGLTPGIHINLVGSILISLSALLLEIFSPITIVIFIVSMSIAHTFIDFIPSIFLGAPDDDTVLSVLPGHKLLKIGKGYEAVYLSTLGSLLALPIIIVMSIIFILFLDKINPLIKSFTPYLLIASSIFLISKDGKKLTAIIVFIISGFLGVIALNSNLEQPLLPLLTGLFGASSMLISINSKVKIPKQKISHSKIKWKDIRLPLFASMISSSLCGFLPGLGSGQAAVLGSSFKKLSRKQFLLLLGSTNTIVLGLSFIVLYTIGKSRTGSAVFVGEILEKISINHVIIILITIIITGILCFHLTLFLGKKFSTLMSKISYTKMSIAILVFICIIVLIFSGPKGFVIFVLSTLIGLYGIISGARRINLMGCLIIPIILFYLV